MDANTAFLNDNLEESFFISQSEGFITQGEEQKVCKLNRSIYRLNQHLDHGTIALILLSTLTILTKTLINLVYTRKYTKVK